MAFGDTVPSTPQRLTAFAGCMVALFELAVLWVAGLLMRATADPGFLLLTCPYLLIIAGNGALFMGVARPPRHWLRIGSVASLALMIGVPLLLIIGVEFLR